MGSEKFLNRIIKTLGITMGRRPKGRTRKMESQTIENRMCSYFIKKIEGEEEK